ncbi:MAG: hypothetical protein PWQ12_2059, partial [Clostridiales bacterium]|nr:hypothetical protein [Clostridiales bacterium]
MTIKPFFTIKEALKSLWRNRMMSIASITSVSATLMILGVIFVLIVNINAVAQSAKEQFDSIQIFMSDEASLDEIQSVKTQIEGIEGVESVTFESKSDALEHMKEQWADNAYLLEGLEENPLPNSLIIYLSDIYYSEHVLESIDGLPGIEEVNSYQEIIEQLLSITEVIRKAGMAIIFVLISFVMGITMATTILVAQYKGAQQDDMVKKTINNSMLLLLASAITVSVIGVVFNRHILNLMNTPESLVSMASGYLNIFLGGLVFMFGYNVTSAILRGLGDSRTPLRFLAYSTVINVVLDPLLIFGIGPLPVLGIQGAALATIISQAISFYLA